MIDESLYAELQAKLRKINWKHERNQLRQEIDLVRIGDQKALTLLRNEIKIAAATIVARIAEEEDLISPIRKLIEIESIVDGGSLAALIKRSLDG